MSEERLIENDSVYDVVTFDLIVDGKVIDETIEVLSISVNKEVNRIATARVVIKDGDPAEETFEVSESNDFVPGKEIEIKIGRDSKNETAFKGIIIKQQLRIRESGYSELCIEAKDKAVMMTIGRHSKYYEKKKDSEIIEEIIGQYSGVSSDVEATTLKHDEMVQYHCTDWDFVMLRAEANGKIVLVDDGKVSVKAPDTSQTEKLSLLFGGTLLSFDAEMDARTQLTNAVANSWDYAAQKLFETNADSSQVKEPGNLSGKNLAESTSPKKFDLRHTGHVLEEELTEWAKACITKSRLAKIRGVAKVRVGTQEAKPGDVVELNGMGARFNGNAFISGIAHEISEGTWDTHVQFGLDPAWYARHEDIVDFNAAGLLPGIRGLQIGKVVKLQDDPDGQNRIQVKLPILDNNAQGIWARVVSLDAGKDRGAFFMPELDDEVIVGFLNDDPRDPLILGMVHSSKNPAPLLAKDENHEKGFTTRSKMHILFNDEKKTITIDTPAGNKVVLDEDAKSIEITDQNKNTITLQSDGITIKSPKNITLDAGANLTLKAKANIVVDGAQVDIKAKGPLNAQGAISKLSSQGITEIQGSLVKIN